jgi:prophage regulatory protein
MPPSGDLQEDFAARLNAIDSTQPPLLSREAGTPADGGPVRFLRLSEVRHRVPYSRATIYRLITAGQFPRPYSLGARAVAWLESEVDAWIAARVKAAQMQQGNAPARPAVR